jgi:Type VI secretion system/phage-baseplate injector OB domain
MPPQYGKFRGIVVDNVDPEGIGRVMVKVPAVLGVHSLWALPCVPYSPAPPTPFEVPQPGSQVWVEFEGGNPELPIWTGCFWTKPAI